MSITAKTIQAVEITASSIIAKTIQVYSNIVCRYVSNFNGTSSYAEFVNDITLTADYEMEFDFKLDNLNSVHFLSSKDSTSYRLFYDAGVQRIKTQPATNDFVGSTLSSDIYITCVLKRSSGVTTVILNGDSFVGDEQPDTNNGPFNSIGAKWVAATGVSPFNGNFKNYKLWTGGDRDTGTLLVDLPMDETSETSTVNYINRTGNTDYNATGYNITTEQECE